MVTETMNIAEIQDELKKDYFESEIDMKVHNRLMDNKYRRIALKHTGKYFFNEFSIFGKQQQR